MLVLVLHMAKVEVESTEACAIVPFSPWKMVIVSAAPYLYCCISTQGPLLLHQVAPQPHTSKLDTAKLSWWTWAYIYRTAQVVHAEQVRLVILAPHSQICTSARDQRIPAIPRLNSVPATKLLTIQRSSVRGQLTPNPAVTSRPKINTHH